MILPRFRSMILSFCVLLTALLVGAGSAVAAPAVFTDAATTATGASVTVSNTTPLPGERIQISGSGFHGEGGQGSPIAAIKPNEGQPVRHEGAPAGGLAWVYGGEDAILETTGPGGTDESFASFEVSGAGTFSGWVEVPVGIADFSPAGTGVNAGKHTLRILSGSLSTGTNTTAPITFQALLQVEERLTLGFTNNADTPQFFPGSTLPASGGNLTVKGRDFNPDSNLVAKVNGSPVTISSGGTTDASGDFDARVSIPSGLSDGSHQLEITDVPVSGDPVVAVASIRTVRHSAELITKEVRPGGLIVVDTEGYLGVSGAAQGTALNLAGTVINAEVGNEVATCPRGDSTGSGRLTGRVPDDATGDLSLNVLAGRDCVATAPPIVTDPFPRPFNAGPVVVSNDAPLVTTFARVAAGELLEVDAHEFGAPDVIQATIDGQPVGDPMIADLLGTADADLPVASGIAAGKHLLLLRGSSGAAAAVEFEVVGSPTAAITTQSPHRAGTSVGVRLEGFLSGAATGGQVVELQVDDIAATKTCVATDETGSADATVELPAALPAGAHRVEVKSTGCQGPVGPVRSFSLDFGSDVEPVITPAKPLRLVSARVLKGNKFLSIRVAAGNGKRVQVVVRSTGKVKVAKKRKARVLVAKAAVAKPKATLKVRLTPAARKAFRFNRTIRVRVQVRQNSGKTVARNIRLTRVR